MSVCGSPSVTRQMSCRSATGDHGRTGASQDSFGQGQKYDPAGILTRNTTNPRPERSTSTAPTWPTMTPPPGEHESVARSKTTPDSNSPRKGSASATWNLNDGDRIHHALPRRRGSKSGDLTVTSRRPRRPGSRSVPDEGIGPTPIRCGCIARTGMVRSRAGSGLLIHDEHDRAHADPARAQPRRGPRPPPAASVRQAGSTCSPALHPYSRQTATACRYTRPGQQRPTRASPHSAALNVTATPSPRCTDWRRTSSSRQPCAEAVHQDARRADSRRCLRSACGTRPLAAARSAAQRRAPT